jgi:hypothetical protein
MIIQPRRPFAFTQKGREGGVVCFAVPGFHPGLQTFNPSGVKRQKTF